MEIDVAGLLQNKQQAEPIDKPKENKWWEAEGSPPGSHQDSLAVYDERGRPVRALGATHYLHLADGRVIPGMGHVTHYSEPDGDGERVTTVIACHAA